MPRHLQGVLIKYTEASLSHTKFETLLRNINKKLKSKAKGTKQVGCHTHTHTHKRKWHPSEIKPKWIHYCIFFFVTYVKENYHGKITF